MTKSLADLRKSEHVGRPETTFPICVAGKLNAEFDKIDYELDQLLKNPRNTPASADSDAPQPPRRMGQKGIDPRVHELNARRDELREIMADHIVTLHLRAREDGHWRAWVNDNPPRDDNRLDERAGHNVDALVDWIRDNPRDIVTAINDAAYDDEDWAFIWGNAADGDKWRLAATVRGLHQAGVDVPKSLTPWLPSPKSGGSSS